MYLSGTDVFLDSASKNQLSISSSKEESCAVSMDEIDEGLDQAHTSSAVHSQVKHKYVHHIRSTTN